MPRAEQWKAIPYWPGYEASDRGNIRSVDRTLGDGRRAGGVLLRQSRDPKGYWRVTLRNGSQRRTVRVHVLVAEAFLGPRPAGMQVLHRNDDHDRNDVESIRYGTGEKNMGERVRRERKERRNIRRNRGQVRAAGSACSDPGDRQAP